jgi:hypothetical protein
MKKFLFLSILLVCVVSAKAQRLLSWEFKNDVMIVRNTIGLHTKANIMNVYFAPCFVRNICVYQDRALTNVSYSRIVYGSGIPDDTIPGYTRLQAIDLLNQAVNAKKGNYLGNYQKTGLFVPDTATVGYYYYDKDSALFRVRTEASGWQSLQPKN